MVKSSWLLYRGRGIEEPMVVPRGVHEPRVVGGVVVVPQFEGRGMVVWRAVDVGPFQIIPAAAGAPYIRWPSDPFYRICSS